MSRHYIVSDGLGNRRSIRLSYGTANPLGRRVLGSFIPKRARHRQPFGPFSGHIEQDRVPPSKDARGI